jgi:hypothetical protein
MGTDGASILDQLGMGGQTPSTMPPTQGQPSGVPSAGSGVPPIPGQLSGGGGAARRFDPSQLPEGMTVTLKIPGGNIRLVRPKPQQPSELKYLSESATGQLLQGAQPGTPLPSRREDVKTGEMVPNIPVSPAGVNTLNRAILQGQTESPAVQIGGGEDMSLRTQAIQELYAVGAPLTEANIQEAIRQLSAQ